MTASTPGTPAAAAQPAAAGAPGTITGSLPFTLQVDPLNVRVAAQLVGAGQPVSQPAPAAPAVQAPTPAKKSFFDRYGLPAAIFVFGVLAALAFCFWTPSNPPASAASAASANVNLSAPSVPQQVAPAPAVSTSPVAVVPPAPAVCQSAPVYMESNNYCGFPPPVKPPVAHLTTRPTPRPQQPQSAPTTAGVPAPSAPATAAVPEGGCRYFAGANFIRKGGTTPEKAGTLLYMITNKQIVEASEKFMVDLREQYPTWLAKKDAHDALCLVLNTKWADENQAAEGRQIK